MIAGRRLQPGCAIWWRNMMGTKQGEVEGEIKEVELGNVCARGSGEAIVGDVNNKGNKQGDKKQQTNITCNYATGSIAVD